jgi:hypothetical protein
MEGSRFSANLFVNWISANENNTQRRLQNQAFCLSKLTGR